MTFEWVIHNQTLKFLALVINDDPKCIICYDNDHHNLNKCTYMLERTGLITEPYTLHGMREPHAIKTGADYET